MEAQSLPDIIRAPEEVARRSLTLFSIIGLAFGAPKSEVVGWLNETELNTELTPYERQFVEASPPSEKQIIDAGWHSERLLILCWALGEIAKLPKPDEQCDTELFQRLLPPFAEEDAHIFIARARLRPDSELIAMADEIMQLHWEARNAKLTGAAPKSPVDIEIIQERHHAINWVIGYDGAPWDEVTTDT